MPPRMIDYDALWASSKIALCAAWAQAEYAWLYGLADAYGCFELTSLAVIWGKVAAIRKNLSLERFGQIINEFQGKRLLFVWEEGGKRFDYWTNSEQQLPTVREAAEAWLCVPAQSGHGVTCSVWPGRCAFPFQKCGIREGSEPVTSEAPAKKVPP